MTPQHLSEVPRNPIACIYMHFEVTYNKIIFLIPKMDERHTNQRLLTGKSSQKSPLVLTYLKVLKMVLVYCPASESTAQALQPQILDDGTHTIYVWSIYPGIPTTIKTMGVNITTIAYLRVLIIEIGSTIMLMVVEAQCLHTLGKKIGHIPGEIWKWLGKYSLHGSDIGLEHSLALEKFPLSFEHP